MTLRQQCIEKARELGITLDISRQAGPNASIVVYADAPKGKVFSCTGTHCVSGSAETGEFTRMWIGFLADFKEGLEDCDNGHSSGLFDPETGKCEVCDGD